MTDEPVPPKRIRVSINGQTASKRTRQRVRKFGPEFLLLPKTKDGHILVAGLDGTGWNGWLPIREIKVTQP